MTTHAGPAAEFAFERFAGSAFGVVQIERTLRRSPMYGLRPVGTTSVVFRASLDAPFRAALKLATHDRPMGPAAEAAAFRLSRCLGLTTVPPAVLRRVPLAALQRALEANYLERWPELEARMRVDPQRAVEAAAIFWIEGLHELPLAEPAAREPLMAALKQGAAMPPGPPVLQLMAAQLSDLAVFDLLIGNGDRWSGGNVQGDASGQWLYVRDHDLAFAAQLRPEVQERLLAQLRRVERFSRGLVQRLRALTAARLKQAWAVDALLSQRMSWLQGRVLPGVLDRRRAALAHVQSLIDRHGEDAVLVFP